MPVLMHVLSPLQILDDIYSLFFFQKSFSINPVIYAVWGAIVIGSFDRFFSWLLAIFMTLCMLSTFERTI